MAVPASQAADERYVIDFMKPEDYEKVMELDDEVFVSQNAVIKELGISKEAWRMLETWDTCQWDTTGCSLVTRDKEKGGEIIAFAITAPHNLLREPDAKIFGAMAERSPGFLALFDVAGRTMKEAWSSEEAGLACSVAGRTLRFVAGGTKAGYEGLGIQKKMRAKILDLAVARGYDRMTVETVNPATKHIWVDKFGFRILSEGCFSEASMPDGTKRMPHSKEEFVVLEKTFRKRPARDSGIAHCFTGIGILILMMCPCLSTGCKTSTCRFCCGLCCCNACS
eukprot:gnl/TRDRNA2_/TRDRNA2_202975_c0_seq1.p1 gnl/TRDRNA2_/TRDRNA2_202975_c0~~gnl/TRDRNA2_/TRDRNA2_202975_c0_seq1.p1  ORF type:complete len:281 (-),score=44.88 gnl/TRDRNA2_/TRDRNA2_202975_c0_seq1:51-893(-)